MRRNYPRPGIVLSAIAILFLSLATAGFAEDTDSAGAEVYVIPLREDVDRYLGVFLGRSMEAAKEAGAEVIILEIDTFGGRVDTALEIAARVGAASWARTVAYVPADSGGRGVSWSAGALMAFSASELWMAPGTSMGAAAPVYQTAEGMEAAEEKTVSAVRGQMAALAEKNGYPMGVALAMVDADVILKEVIINGETTLQTADDIDVLERSGSEFEIGRTLSGEGKLLTLTAGEMERYSVSSGTVSTRDELVRSLGYSPGEVRVLEKSRSDSILTLLTSGAVTSILLIVGLVMLYLEITSPGFGVPGTVALICFAVVFGASGLMGNLGPTEIIMFVVGVALLLLEIFIIPGFGIAGISGIVLILGSFVFSMQDFYWPEFDWQWSIVRKNLGVVGFSLLGGLGLIALLMSLMPRAGIFDRLVLHAPGDPGYGGEKRRRRKKKGPDDVPEEKKVPQPSFADRRGVQPGDTGTVLTDLRPVGKVRFGEKTVVAETDGEYYEQGATVVVLRSDGVKVVVAREV